MIPTQFLFPYRVIKEDPVSLEETESIIWTTLFNKESLMQKGVKEVRLKQTQDRDKENVSNGK